MDCLFCNIIDKKEPAYIIYENDDVVAFLDKFAKKENPGHVLVVPKKHQTLCYEEDYDFNLLNEINNVIRLMKQTLGFDGIKILNNNGECAGQVIKHVHFHLIPFYNNNIYENKTLEEITDLFNTHKNE